MLFRVGLARDVCALTRAHTVKCSRTNLQTCGRLHRRRNDLAGPSAGEAIPGAGAAVGGREPCGPVPRTSPSYGGRVKPEDAELPALVASDTSAGDAGASSLLMGGVEISRGLLSMVDSRSKKPAGPLARRTGLVESEAEDCTAGERRGQSIHIATSATANRSAHEPKTESVPNM